MLIQEKLLNLFLDFVTHNRINKWLVWKARICCCVTNWFALVSDRCIYNGVPYMTGDSWEDGCDLRCVCENGVSGTYRCDQRFVDSFVGHFIMNNSQLCNRQNKTIIATITDDAFGIAKYVHVIHGHTRWILNSVIRIFSCSNAHIYGHACTVRHTHTRTRAYTHT